MSAGRAASPDGRRIRVAYDARALQQSLRNSPDGGLGGISRYAYTLIRALVQVEPGLDFLLLVNRREVPPRLAEIGTGSERVSLHRIGMPRRLLGLKRGRAESSVDLFEAPLLSRQIHALRADVVHFTDQPPPTLVRRPTVITLFDLVPVLELAHSRSLDSRLRRRAWRRAARVERVISISDSTAADAERLLGVASERVTVAYPAVDTDVFRPGPADAHEVFGYLRERRFFLHTGVLRRRKNPEGLMHAFGLVARALDADLVCAGPYQTDRPAADGVLQLATAAGVRDRVHLIGDCPDQVLARLYRSAVAGVYPSLYEGFGYPVVEALACGTPSVTSGTSSLPEAGGDLAVYVDPRDPESIAAGMRRAFESGALRRRVRLQGPRWAQRFSASSGAASVARVYRELAETAAITTMASR